MKQTHESDRGAAMESFQDFRVQSEALRPVGPVGRPCRVQISGLGGLQNLARFGVGRLGMKDSRFRLWD